MSSVQGQSIARINSSVLPEDKETKSQNQAQQLGAIIAEATRPSDVSEDLLDGHEIVVFREEAMRIERYVFL